jgi:hypothetical protein
MTLKLHHVHVMFNCQAPKPHRPFCFGACRIDAANGGSGCRLCQFARPPVRASAGISDPPKKKPQPFRAGALRCRREGGGDADHRGGVRAERRRRLPVPQKNSGRAKIGTRQTKRPGMRAEALRRQLPLRRLSPVPDSSLAQIGDSEKRSRSLASRRAPPFPGHLNGIALRISSVWTAAVTRANLVCGAEYVGVSRDLIPLSIGGDSIEIRLGSWCRDVRREQFLSISSEMLASDCPCHRKSGGSPK